MSRTTPTGRRPVDGPMAQTCTCTPTSRCAEHLITDALDIADEADLVLVERTAVSLADLYRKAKQRGVLTARTQYQ